MSAVSGCVEEVMESGVGKEGGGGDAGLSWVRNNNFWGGYSELLRE